MSGMKATKDDSRKITSYKSKRHYLNKKSFQYYFVFFIKNFNTSTNSQNADDSLS